jgi:hypothetical protein
MSRLIKRKDLIYPELCYRIMDVLFEVWAKLGFGHKIVNLR